MKDAAVQVEREPRDISIIGHVVMFADKLFPVDVKHQTIGNASRAHDVVVEVRRPRLQRPARRVGARPDYQLRPEILQALPERRPIHVVTDREPDPAESVWKTFTACPGLVTGSLANSLQ